MLSYQSVEGVETGNLTGSKMGKKELLDASAELQAAFDKIEAIAQEFPDIFYYYKETVKGKTVTSHKESFSALTEAFGSRLGYFRRQIREQIATSMPKPKPSKFAKAELIRPPKGKKNG